MNAPSMDMIAQYGKGKSTLRTMANSAAAKLLCETRGHEHARPCQFCQMQMTACLREDLGAATGEQLKEAKLEVIAQLRMDLKLIQESTCDTVWEARGSCIHQMKYGKFQGTLVADASCSHGNMSAIADAVNWRVRKEAVLMIPDMLEADVVKEFGTPAPKES